MRLVDAALPMFARHETFHPRYGWFRKAYSVAARDPHVFVGSNAPVEVGVGKNMTRSIRFWGLAAKLLVEDPEPPRPRSPGVVPTRMGHAIFGKSGWDPFMEDPGYLMGIALASAGAKVTLTCLVAGLQRIHRR